MWFLDGNFSLAMHVTEGRALRQPMCDRRPAEGIPFPLGGASGAQPEEVSMRSVLSWFTPLSRLSFPRSLTSALKLSLPAVAALVLAVAQTVPAAACGGLIAPNGAVRLERATTLVAWHDGVERYLTTFTYQGDVSSVGYIVPLPAAPIQQVQEGGAWTLQRLEREAHPLPQGTFASAAAPTAADGGVQVLQQEQIEALNIAVIKGDSADDIIHWATDNGFALDGETRGHLQVYSSVTPYFMAAKYDTSAAQARHQLTGDGTPILVTMKTAHPWVPFEVLALDGQQVQADLFLLTDGPVYTSDLGAAVGQSSVGTEIPGAPGFQLAFQEPMNDSLYHDLSTDRNMSWVPRNSWLTYLTLDAPEDEVTYDLGVSSQDVVRVAPFGTAPMAVADVSAHPAPGWLPRLPLGAPEVALSIALLLGIAGLLVLLVRAGLRVQPRLPSAPTPPLPD